MVMHHNITTSQHHTNGVIFTDFVDDDTLASLYQNAGLFIFPSLYEGFGLPPLEAQQYGVPVVSSSASCLPEVLGESALYFDPENVEQMADAIHRGLTDENIRLELKQNAAENLKRFSGERMARETKNIYEKYYPPEDGSASGGKNIFKRRF